MFFFVGRGAPQFKWGRNRLCNAPITLTVATSPVRVRVRNQNFITRRESTVAVQSHTVVYASILVLVQSPGDAIHVVTFEVHWVG